MIIDRKNVEDTFKRYTDNYDTSDEKTPTGWRLLVRG